MQSGAVERVLVDVDGTLCWNLPRVCEYLDTEYGVDIEPDAISEWSYRFEGIDAEIGEVIERMLTQRPAWFLSDLDPVPGARAALDAIGADNEVWITTHRPPETHDLTRAWLADNGFSYDRFVEDVPGNKARIPGDVLVDDYHGNVRNAVDAGMLGVLFDRPYTEPVPGDRSVRVSTWADALEALGVGSLSAGPAPANRGETQNRSGR
jgi:5'(3')-deoxyribonucleotidase